MEAIMLNLLRYEVQSRWMGILGWGIGMGLFGSMYIGIWPEMSALVEDFGDLSIYEAMAIDMATFAGFIASVVVQYVPLLVAIYAIIASTGTLAGEEDRGTLELLLATPLKRWQIVTVKALALAIASLVIVILTGIGDAITLTIVKQTVEVDVSAGQLVWAVVSTWPLLLATMMIGLFLGAYLPNRMTAAIGVTFIFVASYFLKLLTGMVDFLDFLKPFSLFSHINTTGTLFTDGIDVGGTALLLVLAAVFFGLAVAAFQRRNVTVHAWPWQRAQAPT
jgi:ABC-2 type transport system permease protein